MSFLRFLGGSYTSSATLRGYRILVPTSSRNITVCTSLKSKWAWWLYKYIYYYFFYYFAQTPGVSWHHHLDTIIIPDCLCIPRNVSWGGTCVFFDDMLRSLKTLFLSIIHRKVSTVKRLQKWGAYPKGSRSFHCCFVIDASVGPLPIVFDAVHYIQFVVLLRILMADFNSVMVVGVSASNWELRVHVFCRCMLRRGWITKWLQHIGTLCSSFPALNNQSSGQRNIFMWQALGKQTNSQLLLNHLKRSHAHDFIHDFIFCV